MKTITIKGKEYNLKYSTRAILLFESSKNGERFDIKTKTDELLFLHCILTCSNEDYSLDFLEELIPEIDEHPEINIAFNQVMLDEVKRQEKALIDYLAPSEEKEGDKKKV